MGGWASWISTLIAAAIGWLGLEFVGRPVRRFFDARQEVSAMLTAIREIQVVEPHNRYDDRQRREYESAVAEVRAQADAFRGLGRKISAIGRTETPARLVLKALRFDASAAGDGLITFAEMAEQFPDNFRGQAEAVEAEWGLGEFRSFSARKRRTEQPF